MKHSISDALSYIKKEISVEPVLFLCGISYNLVANIYNSLKQEKVCKVGSRWFGDGKVYTNQLQMRI